jgi:hypothetical protein
VTWAARATFSRSWSAGKPRASSPAASALRADRLGCRGGSPGDEAGGAGHLGFGQGRFAQAGHGLAEAFQGLGGLSARCRCRRPETRFRRLPEQGGDGVAQALGGRAVAEEQPALPARAWRSTSRPTLSSERRPARGRRPRCATGCGRAGSGPGCARAPGRRGKAKGSAGGPAASSRARATTASRSKCRRRPWSRAGGAGAPRTRAPGPGEAGDAVHGALVELAVAVSAKSMGKRWTEGQARGLVFAAADGGCCSVTARATSSAPKAGAVMVGQQGQHVGGEARGEAGADGEHVARGPGADGGGAVGQEVAVFRGRQVGRCPGQGLGRSSAALFVGEQQGVAAGSGQVTERCRAGWCRAGAPGSARRPGPRCPLPPRWPPTASALGAAAAPGPKAASTRPAGPFPGLPGRSFRPRAAEPLRQGLAGQHTAARARSSSAPAWRRA